MPVQLKKNPPARKNKNKKKNLENLIRNDISLDRKMLAQGRRPNGSVEMGMHKPDKALGPVEAFATALINPFSPTAVGAKVPDSYSFPTNSYHIKTSQTIGGVTTSDSTFGLVYLANPLATVLDVGLIRNGVTSLNGPGGFSRFAGYTGVLGATTAAQLSAICSGFRVVGGGIRIRNLQPALTGTGRIFVACVPVAENGMIDVGTLTSQTPSAGGYNAIFNNLGLPLPVTCATAGIQALPLSDDFVVSSLISGDEIDINFQVFHPTAYSFKPTIESNLVNLTTSTSDSVTWASSGLVIAGSTSKQNTQSNGTAAIIIWGEGFPTGASVPPIEIDYILHLETTPLVSAQTTSNSTGLNPVPDSAPLVFRGSSMAVETALAIANNPRNIIKEVRTGMNQVNDFDDKYMGGFGKKLIGMATRGALKFMM